MFKCKDLNPGNQVSEPHPPPLGYAISQGKHCCRREDVPWKAEQLDSHAQFLVPDLIRPENAGERQQLSFFTVIHQINRLNPQLPGTFVCIITFDHQLF